MGSHDFVLDHMTSCDSHLTILWRRERLKSRVFEGFQLFLYFQEFFPLGMFPDVAIFRCSDLCMHVLHYMFHQTMDFLELRKQLSYINFLRMRKLQQAGIKKMKHIGFLAPGKSARLYL